MIQVNSFSNHSPIIGQPPLAIKVADFTVILSARSFLAFSPIASVPQFSVTGGVGGTVRLTATSLITHKPILGTPLLTSKKKPPGKITRI